MSGKENIFVPVTDRFIRGLVIGNGGKNIKEIKRKTHTKIRTCDENSSGKELGFEITGTATCCEEARTAILRIVDNPPDCVKESVPQQFSRLLKRKNGACSFRVIENECNVKFFWPKGSEQEKHVIFTIKGLRCNCEKAKGMLRASIKEWEDALTTQTNSQSLQQKVNEQKTKIDMYVEEEYMNFVVGVNQKNIDRVATKSGTRIVKSPKQVPNRRFSEGNGMVKLEITGLPSNCLRAQSLIRSSIVHHNDKMKKKDYGGDTHFVCQATKNDNEEFRLKPDKRAPKLDGFIQGQRYRIESEVNEDDEDESEFSTKTISEIKDHLLTSLKKIEKLKNEEEIMADLWCHFGKVLVYCVDEEVVENVLTLEDIKKRLITITSNDEVKDIDSFWKASFEVGVDPSHLKDDAFPNCGDENLSRELDLTLIHSQRRYDFGFSTPSYRSVRLKAWEGLPPGNDEPPFEVKNILNPVSFEAVEGNDIKAWICCPSTTILRGEIMIPNSRYDCRMKLRAGSRRVTDENSVRIEEDAVLSDYLSKCEFNKGEYRMHLPDENIHEIPKGFECEFYREAKERLFEVTLDGECFTVIVWDEKGWDSDSSDERYVEQFGVRVVMNSWSDAMLSSERQWKAEEILEKLEEYMEFLFLLKDHIFYNDK